jgi:hypothetical protein
MHLFKDALLVGLGALGYRLWQRKLPTGMDPEIRELLDHFPADDRKRLLALRIEAQPLIQHLMQAHRGWSPANATQPRPSRVSCLERET